MVNLDPHTCEMNSSKVSEESSTPADNRLYREIIGSLVYIMTATRPDLCYSVTKLSQHLSAPTVSHMNTAKHVLRYLKGTANRNLIFKKADEPLHLVGYCDADWGTSDDRRSITGYGFQLCRRGPLISWKSRKQPTVALSTCEAEYMSLASAVQEAKFLSYLLNGVVKGMVTSVTLHCDNQGTLALAKNPVHHQRSKHIDICYHFVRSEVQNKFLHLMYIASKDNLADIFTKPLSGPRMKTFIPTMLGV